MNACKDCVYAHAITAFVYPDDVPCEVPVGTPPWDVITHYECRRYPAISSFWGTSFPKAMAACGEFSKPPNIYRKGG